MPLLLTKQIDRSIFSLNEFVYGIYFDDVFCKSASPYLRWARGQHQMLPVTVYEAPDKPLLTETFQRDRANLYSESQEIFDKLRAGSVVLMSVDEYDAALTAVSRVNPTYASILTTHTAKWRGQSYVRVDPDHTHRKVEGLLGWQDDISFARTSS